MERKSRLSEALVIIIKIKHSLIYYDNEYVSVILCMRVACILIPVVVFAWVFSCVIVIRLFCVFKMLERTWMKVKEEKTDTRESGHTVFQTYGKKKKKYNIDVEQKCDYIIFYLPKRNAVCSILSHHGKHGALSTEHHFVSKNTLQMWIWVVK